MRGHERAARVSSEQSLKVVVLHMHVSCPSHRSSRGWVARLAAASSIPPPGCHGNISVRGQKCGCQPETRRVPRLGTAFPRVDALAPACRLSVPTCKATEQREPHLGQGPPDLLPTYTQPGPRSGGKPTAHWGRNSKLRTRGRALPELLQGLRARRPHAPAGWGRGCSPLSGQ